MNITKRIKLFAHIYVNEGNFNCFKSMVLAGFKDNTARKKGYIYLKDPDVSQLIEDEKAKKREKIEEQLTKENLLEGMMNIFLETKQKRTITKTVRHKDGTIDTYTYEEFEDPRAAVQAAQFLEKYLPAEKDGEGEKEVQSTFIGDKEIFF